MNQFDKTWAQINGAPGRPLAPQSVGVINKPGRVKQLLIAIKLFFTTNYRWSSCWRVAGY